MDGVSQLLAVVIISLTVLLVVVGIQVILNIVDIRRALRRLNNLLDDSIIGGGLIRPDKLTGVLELVKKKLQKRGDGEMESI